MSHMKSFEHLKIQLDVIKEATNNFADESCIGRGGFGSVYKGKIANHMMVAMKRLDPKFGQGDTEFWKEVMMLSQYKHENIVSLLGFCDDAGEKILVYEYVSNKGLDCHLNNDNLRWIGRLNICIGVAQGLVRLHSAVIGTQQRVLHRDIKSSNILLDQDWNAKISDFGLSKLGPANQEHTFLFSTPVGTRGYCDPLYAETGLLTKESDVYSFGVVLFEVLCGRLSIDNKNVHQSLIKLARKSYEENNIKEIVYGNIKDEINPNSLHVFATIAYKCLKRDHEERPLMSDILGALEAALLYQGVINDPVANSYSPREVLEPNRTKDIGMDSKSKGTGLLVVTIHEGAGLKAKHPYLMLCVRPESRRTTTKFYNQTPVWKETFQFNLEKPAEAMLLLIVCSESRMDRILRKGNLGSLKIRLADVVKEKHTNNIYLIRDGQIRVELHFQHALSEVLTKQ